MAIATMLLLLLPWDEPTPGIFIEGKASFYNIRRMDEVAYNRDMELGDHAGFVAMNRAGDLGRSVWIEYNGVIYGGEYGFLSIDCAQEGAHYEERERRGLVIEVSWEQAQAWKMVKPMPVKVYFVRPIPDPPNAY